MDALNYRVQIFTKNGIFVSKFGSYGTGDGEFQNTLRISSSSQYIYAADISKSVVQIFDLEGNFVAKIEGFTGIYSVNYKNGLIYTTDNVDDKVRIYTDYETIAITIL